MNGERCSACGKPMGNSLHTVDGKPTHMRCDKPKRNTYKCGHTTDGLIIIGSGILETSEYITWKEQNIDDGSMEKCFPCHIEDLRKHGFKVGVAKNV